jgi:hypothetical protein
MRRQRLADGGGKLRQVVGELVRHEHPGTAPRRDVALGLQLLERQQRRDARDAEIGGQRPRGHQPGAGAQPALEDGAPDSRVDLLLERATRPGIDRDQRVRRGLVSHRLELGSLGAAERGVSGGRPRDQPAGGVSL